MSQQTAAPISTAATTANLWNFWSELLWPRVLTAAAYGLRPGRLGLAFFALVIISLLLALGGWIDEAIRDTPVVTWQTRAGEPWQIPWRTFVATPMAWAYAYPITTLIFGPLTLFIGLLMVGAISRVTACEIALDRHLSWYQGLTYAARFWKSLLGANLGPIIGIWFLALLIALFGLILLRFPVVNILGAILFPIALLLAFAAAAIALVFVLGVWLITPSIMADGSDAIDAIQRAYAYVIDRPVRLVIYLLLAALGLAGVVFIAAIFIFATVHFAGWAAGQWAGEDGRAMIWAGILAAIRDQPLGPFPLDDPEGTYRTGAALIRFWTAIPAILLFAVILSSLTAAATMVYLAMRRLCDGQDISEIWWPGKVEEAMAATLEARANAANSPL
jgi:hypothetical protein